MEKARRLITGAMNSVGPLKKRDPTGKKTIP